mmetsp:Transcript_38993/g.94784  ORF Transcript_38993/g.94784 Transcript_38993/m.94784 type:complete len:226 (+) Transcript_38993:99-776(+)
MYVLIALRKSRVSVWHLQPLHGPLALGIERESLNITTCSLINDGHRRGSNVFRLQKLGHLLGSCWIRFASAAGLQPPWCSYAPRSKGGDLDAGCFALLPQTASDSLNGPLGGSVHGTTGKLAQSGNRGNENHLSFSFLFHCWNHLAGPKPNSFDVCSKGGIKVFHCEIVDRTESADSGACNQKITAGFLSTEEAGSLTAISPRVRKSKIVTATLNVGRVETGTDA